MSDERDEALKILGDIRTYLEFLSRSGIDGLYKTGTGQVREAAPYEAAGSGPCAGCPLSGGTRVAGRGPEGARVMFVGGYPTGEDISKNSAMAGEDGILLSRMTGPRAMGLKPEDIYVTLAVKCGGGTGLDMAARCRPLLDEEIKRVKPQMIVAMGVLACLSLAGSKDVRKIRGAFKDYSGIAVMPTWSPGELLDDESLKKETWEDLKAVMKELQK